jgi:Calx-beta domain/Carboxypeptidase regulatory-like domain
MSKVKRATAFWMLLLLAPLAVVAQDTVRDNATLQQGNPLGRVEIPDSEETRRFVEEHSFNNPSFRQKQSGRANIETTPLAQGSKQVRLIYLVPSDKNIRADYQNAIANAISELQVFYRSQMGSGYAFSLHSPTVEVYQTPHTAAFYSTGNNSRPGGFWESVVGDGFALTGGGFNDPNNRWIFYIDADLICGQYTGGTSGVALLPANDLRGLTHQSTVPICPGDPSTLLSVNRWIGGLGHELGHALNLPHPPGCDNGNCTGGQHAYNSLMYVGYSIYPNTYLLNEDRTTLLAGGFFNVLSLDPTAHYEISGRITSSDNTGLAGATVTINETQTSVTSDANGNFHLTGLPAGGNYSITVAKAGYRFTTPGVLFNNLDRNQTVNFSGTTDQSVLQFSSGAYSVNESDSTATITVIRSNSLAGNVSVNYVASDTVGLQNCNVINGRASSRCDYVGVVGTLRFAANETQKTISLPVVDDTYLEGPESFSISLTGPTGGAVLGTQSSATVTITDNGNDGIGLSNPIDETNFFVRQHYIDFLGREPDPASIGWNNQINNCVPSQPSCDRLSVSQGIYNSPEFKDRGYFIYKFYSVAFGRKPSYDEFVLDRARVSGFQTEAELEQSKLDFITDFMSRAEFSVYNGLTNDQYVLTLFNRAGVSQVTVNGVAIGLTQMQESMNSGKTRARVLREMVESPEVSARFQVESTIVMHYFGYLRRDPDAAYQDWINIYNQTGDSRNVTNGFVNSAEYRARFSQ